MNNVPDRSTHPKRKAPFSAEQIAEAKQDAAEFGTKCGGKTEPVCYNSTGVICDKHWGDVTKSYTALLKSKGLNRAGNRKGRKRR